jgi:flagellin
MEEKMALTINTNLYALNSQRNLRKSESPLATAMQRLSSGLRINSAKDDAAGLAIATRMTRQINGLSVAMRNANDGVSFAQTAEGAMDEMVNSLQRIYELSEQAASYNTSTDRSSMNLEVTQIISELNRVVNQTRFNGEKFLNQAFTGNFQVGIEVNETINISTSSVSPDAFGVQSTRINFDESSANRDSIASAVAAITNRSAGLAANAALAGQDLGDAISNTITANNSLSIINRINQYTGNTNVTAFSFGNAYAGTVAVADGASSVGIAAGFLTINGISIGSTAAAGATTVAAMASALVVAINAKSTSTGVYAVELGSADTGATTSIALVNTTGAAITISVATANMGAAGSGNVANFFGTSGGSVSAGQNGQIIFSTPLGTSNITAVVADKNSFGYATAVADITVSNKQSINDISVTTIGGASLGILAVKQGLETMNTEKAKLGATLNRFEATIRNLDNVRENITAARSRTMDADFAVETANLTKAQIMQQAGISVLSQANTLPQQVLSLLGGR